MKKSDTQDDPADLARRVLAADAEATPGPWISSPTGAVVAKKGTGPFRFPVAQVPTDKPEAHRNKGWIALTRTAAPALARAYLAAVEDAAWWQQFSADVNADHAAARRWLLSVIDAGREMYGAADEQVGERDEYIQTCLARVIEAAGGVYCEGHDTFSDDAIPAVVALARRCDELSKRDADHIEIIRIQDADRDRLRARVADLERRLAEVLGGDGG